MVDFPSVPRLDLDEAPTTASKLPLRPLAVPVREVVVEAAELVEVAAQPEPLDSVATAASSARAEESVEEVLHQTAEQTVRLSHVEERVKDLNRGFDDLREELLAGFSEMRGIVEQGRQAMFRVESTQAETSSAMQQRITVRLEAVEEQTTKTHKRQSIMLALVVGQAVMLAVLLWVVLGLRGPLDEASVAATASPGAASDRDAGAAQHQAVEPPRDATASSAAAANGEADSAELQKRKAKPRKRAR
jgi:hypothetical protein